MGDANKNVSASAENTGGVIRKHESTSSESDSTPRKPPRNKPKIDIEDAKILDAIEGLQKRFDSSVQDLGSRLEIQTNEQKQFRQSMEQRLTNIEANLNSKIEAESKAIREELQMEVATVRDQVTAVETNLKSIQTNIQADLDEMKRRIDALENSEGGVPLPDFSPETTVVVTGMKYNHGEDILSKAKDLVKNGLGLELAVKNAMRTPFRNDKPGTVVKIEFSSKQDKIAALKEKAELSKHQQFKRVYMRSSQPHIERVMHLNTMTLLKELKLENKYSILGSRLVHKDDIRKGRADRGAPAGGADAQAAAQANGGGRGAGQPQ